MKQRLLSIYDVHYKKLMLISFILLFLSFASLGATYSRTGEFFKQGVSLKGGITMTVPANAAIDTHELQNTLALANPEADITVRHISEGGTTSALIIEAADITPEQLENSLRTAGIPLESGTYSIEAMGSALGAQFFSQTLRAVVLAFLAMSIVVFLTFRSFVPSLLIIFSVVSDLVSTLAVLNLLGVTLGTAGIAALLMLIGYGVDNNILLTTKVLKRKGEGGTTFERTVSATKTGLIMTITAIASAAVGLAFTQSDVIRQIMLIVLIGLLCDLIYTYFQNSGILRWYLERKQHGTQ